MMVVQIPVSPLTRKILLTHNGYSQPISFGPEEPGFFISFINRENRDNVKLIQMNLTQSIGLKLSRDMARIVRKNGHQIGYALHRFHIEQMMSFVLGRWMDGLEAKNSLYRFYHFYNLEEDDYSIDTAYRKWTRYKSVFPHKKRLEKTELKDNLGRCWVHRRPATNQEMALTISNALNANPELFIQRDDPILKPTTFGSLYTFVMAEHGQYAKDYLAKVMKVGIRSVNRRIRSFKDLIDTTPTLKEAVVTQ